MLNRFMLLYEPREIGLADGLLMGVLCVAIGWLINEIRRMD